MANIEVKKVEEQLNHRLLFSVQVSGDTDHMEFPVGIPDQGSPAANEAAVLDLRARIRRAARGSSAAPFGCWNTSIGDLGSKERAGWFRLVEKRDDRAHASAGRRGDPFAMSAAPSNE